MLRQGTGTVPWSAYDLRSRKHLFCLGVIRPVGLFGLQRNAAEGISPSFTWCPPASCTDRRYSPNVGGSIFAAPLFRKIAWQNERINSIDPFPTAISSTSRWNRRPIISFNLNIIIVRVMVQERGGKIPFHCRWERIQARTEINGSSPLSSRGVVLSSPHALLLPEVLIPQFRPQLWIYVEYRGLNSLRVGPLYSDPGRSKKIYIDKRNIVVYLVSQTYRIYPSVNCQTIVSQLSEMGESYDETNHTPVTRTTN